MKTKNKGWINPDGSPKSVEELKEISKSWSREQWEEYAQSLEVPQREKLLKHPTQIEQFPVNQSVFSSGEPRKDKKDLQLRSIVFKEIANLPLKQRQLIDLLFKQELTLAQVAKEMGVCKSTIMRNRNRLLEKLKVNILKKIHLFDMKELLAKIAS